MVVFFELAIMLSFFGGGLLIRHLCAMARVNPIDDTEDTDRQLLIPITNNIKCKNKNATLFVKHPVICDILQKELIDIPNFGLLVFGSPNGSGKSAYIDNLIRTYPHIIYVRNTKPWILIMDKLNITNMRPVSDQYPNGGTIFIMDNMNIGKLSNEMKAYLTELATDSFNSKKFKVLCCTSDIDTYHDMLQLNNGHKIQSICEPSLTKWDSGLMTQYVRRRLPWWKEDDQNELVSFCAPSFSCGILHSMCTTIINYSGMTPTLELTNEIKREYSDKITDMNNQWSRWEILEGVS